MRSIRPSWSRGPNSSPASRAARRRRHGIRCSSGSSRPTRAGWNCMPGSIPTAPRHATAKSPLARNHIGVTNPDAVKTYGRYLWMDPGEAAASQRTLDVILDVVRRYDIDGVHIDDYFYPYPIDAAASTAAPEGVALDAGVGQKQELEFPDQPSWQRYLLGGGTLDRAGWRRQNVNSLIEALYLGIHKEKSWVRFGISPFGIGPPGPPPRRHRRLQPVRQAVRGRRTVAGQRLARLPGAAAVLAGGAGAAGVRRAARLLAGAEYPRPPRVAGAVHQPHRQHGQGVRAGGNRQADRRHAQPCRRAGPPAFQHRGVDGKPQGHQRPVARAGVSKRGAGAGQSVAGIGIAGGAGRDGAARRQRRGAEAVGRRWQAGGALCDLVALRQRVALRRGAASRPVVLLPDDAAGGAAQAVVVSAVDRLGNESERISVLR